MSVKEVMQPFQKLHKTSASDLARMASPLKMWKSSSRALFCLQAGPCGFQRITSAGGFKSSIIFYNLKQHGWSCCQTCCPVDFQHPFPQPLCGVRVHMLHAHSCRGYASFTRSMVRFDLNRLWCPPQQTVCQSDFQVRHSQGFARKVGRKQEATRAYIHIVAWCQHLWHGPFLDQNGMRRSDKWIQMGDCFRELMGVRIP